jgi:hypothetical protein
MGQHHYAVYQLSSDPSVFIYTTAKNKNTLGLLEEFGFKHIFTLYSYGWSCSRGHMYSLSQYFSMDDKDRMIKLVRINNGTDKKVKQMYREVFDAQGVDRKRWWEYYRIKK